MDQLRLGPRVISSIRIVGEPCRVLENLARHRAMVDEHEHRHLVRLTAEAPDQALRGRVAGYAAERAPAGVLHPVEVARVAVADPRCRAVVRAQRGGVVAETLSIDAPDLGAEHEARGIGPEA